MTDDRDDRWRYSLLVVATTVAGVGGYAGYVVYPRFGLPGIAGAAVLGLAAAAGFAAFFSPCSFPLLAALLARQTDSDAPRRARLRRAVLFATALSVGAATFVLTVGVAFAFGGRSLAAAVTFTSPSGRVIRAVVGSILLVLGLAQTGRLQLNLRQLEPAVHDLLKRQARLRRERPVVGMAVFGFGYLGAGFG
ncbi:MAG: hypothetical protein KY460_13980 [Actinobacteria bacterium]|nr:hypothetical protein [Actinomycetota bacterium]